MCARLLKAFLFISAGIVLGVSPSAAQFTNGSSGADGTPGSTSGQNGVPVFGSDQSYGGPWIGVNTGSTGGAGGNGIVSASGDGGNGGAGGGADARSITILSHGQVTNGAAVTTAGGAGGAGADAATGDDGGNGGNAGSSAGAATTVLGSVGGTATATSAGGTGGQGGDAGDSTLPGGGGPPNADGGNAGDGGTGGAAGNVTIVVSGTAGAVLAQSLGGNGGQAGDRAALGGNPGRDGRGGDAGDVTVIISGTAGNVTASSIGGDGRVDGAGGDVAVTVKGTVNGDIDATSTGSTTGQIKVLIDGGVVTGTISANAAATSTLEFKFDVADRTEFNAAAAALTAPGAAVQGTLTINGSPYTWTGFDGLSNLLRYTGPNDTVVVTVTGGPSSETGNAFGAPRGGTSGPLLATGPVRCMPRTLTAQRQGDGSVRLISKIIEGSGFFEFGFIRGTAFDRSPGTPDWAVEVLADKRNQHAKITDETGALIGICVLAGRAPKDFAALR